MVYRCRYTHNRLRNPTIKRRIEQWQIHYLLQIFWSPRGAGSCSVKRKISFTSNALWEPVKTASFR
ncbi:MAG: hypothetical protein CEE38_23605 [Planctomycetes bacterium B3_Pla]|nr:MAG: hypothetical protein CEE38_23605 [Planctomycetes bacterium B3_Pla]